MAQSIKVKGYIYYPTPRNDEARVECLFAVAENGDVYTCGDVPGNTADFDTADRVCDVPFGIKRLDFAIAYYMEVA